MSSADIAGGFRTELILRLVSWTASLVLILSSSAALSAAAYLQLQSAIIWAQVALLCGDLGLGLATTRLSATHGSREVAATNQRRLKQFVLATPIVWTLAALLTLGPVYVVLGLAFSVSVLIRHIIIASTQAIIGLRVSILATTVGNTVASLAATLICGLTGSGVLALGNIVAFDYLTTGATYSGSLRRDNRMKLRTLLRQPAPVVARSISVKDAIGTLLIGNWLKVAGLAAAGMGGGTPSTVMFVASTRSSDAVVSFAGPGLFVRTVLAVLRGDARSVDAMRGKAWSIAAGAAAAGFAGALVASDDLSRASAALCGASVGAFAVALVMGGWWAHRTFALVGRVPWRTTLGGLCGTVLLVGLAALQRA